MDKRIELCCHTKMSKLQGINSANEYIEEAIKRGYTQIAITDKNSTQAFWKANEYLKKCANNNNFKIIYGTELNFMESINSKENYTIYIYVKEQIGLKNLYKLVSKSYEHTYFEKPVIYREELNKFRSGLLFASIGKNSEVYKNVDNSNIGKIINYYDFIGIEPYKSDKNINKKIEELCTKVNKILIGTSECNYINPEDYKCNEILNFYKKSTKIDEENNNYFQTTDELIMSFNYIENAKKIVVDNTIKIGEQIQNIDIMTVKCHYPKIEFADKIISKKCYDKVYEMYGEKLQKEINNRLELELRSIIKNSFQAIYLICSELVEYSNKLGYEVETRGSVACSLVAYLLGISNIDPIKYKLPFEVFAGKNYDKEPDIALNFSLEMQDKIFTYLQNKFGKDKIIFGGTISCLYEKRIAECLNEYEKTFGKENIKEKGQTINKLMGIKRQTGEHPGGIFIIPKDIDIMDICPTEIGNNGNIKTHHDYYEVCDLGLCKFSIFRHDNPTILHELEKETNTNSKDIKLNDKETLKLLLHANDKLYEVSTNGIPEFGSNFVKKMIQIAKPQDFNDLVCISVLAHGSNTWNHNADTLIKNKNKKVSEVISNREDMYNYLLENGIDDNIAYDIVKFITAGKALRGRSLFEHIENRYKDDNKQWKTYREIMTKHNIPKWYIESAEKIAYMFPKSHAINCTSTAFKIARYKVHYPKAFYKVYFKVKSKLDIKNYYCKRQVKTELNRLYAKNNYDDIDKINDLELIFEMYNRGVMKEKEEIKDDYNLINSRAIADYCRSIKHKFNTEELAVLVYRNNRMSIEEKIDKYNDLIENYPDMEVIEKINCKHYKSVKTMIKKEIQRLKSLNEKLIREDDNCIWVWTEYNKSTLKYEHKYDLDHTSKSYSETIKNIQRYINKYNDTIFFTITKKYFDKRKSSIHAEYNVENKKAKLININENNNEFLDIEEIFLNLPTPFEKGDILVQNRRTMRNIGDESNIFVLDYLCTWKENLEELLKRGNYDSTDMIGYGYYLLNEDTTEFVRDDKWDYDSFEYYDEELTGRNRILKDISSFIKGKIGLELFVHAYDIYKTEYKNTMPDFYTDEALKLAGMTEADINNHNEHDKIYNMSKEKQEDFYKKYTCLYEKFDKKQIKQIETDFDNNIYILTNKGMLYKTIQYEDDLELLSENIVSLFFLDGVNLYKITNQNIILPIEDKENLNNTDKYLNNHNCKYKKIETSKMHIVALTEEGDVHALCGGYPNLGIIPDNFVNVEDITIIEDEDGIDMPYIYKNNIFTQLYIQ